MTQRLFILLVTSFLFFQCTSKTEEANLDAVSEQKTFDWNTATIYFMLTDRFHNGDTTNEVNFNRTETPSHLRGFEGGDFTGITEKIEAGYFNDLGVDALWFSPVFEQIHGGTDEGSGLTYAFHGYWPGDWTSIEPNFGTEEELKALVKAAHEKGIRILFDVVINHTGPVTAQDAVWPEDWVRTSPQCEYKDYPTTANCTLVKNLPDILTDSDKEVDLPPQLVSKWKSEGRYDQEMKELDEFFETTGYPRAPRYYLIKWLLDLIKDYGIDGFRVDTVKHLHEDVWEELAELAQETFDNWKIENSDMVIDDQEFFMLGEVYGYGIAGKEYYDFGDRKVDYFAHGFNSLINFNFVYDAKLNYDSLFTKYDTLMASEEMQGKGILNYISSHDDGNPFDGIRQKSMEAANKLLLSPGAVQIYYGDETDRSLVIPEATGDATLRSYMNWESVATDSVAKVLEHWKKLGTFRQQHSAISKGKHKKIQEQPYVFSRAHNNDKVVIGLDLPAGNKEIAVEVIFEEGQVVLDYYSNQKAIVTEGKVTITSEYATVLLAGLN